MPEPTKIINQEPASVPDSKSEQTGAAIGAEGASSEQLQKRIEELEAQVKEKENRYVYLYAEFENFKKRAVRERAELLRYGWESAARELLEVIDNLERAISHLPPGADKTLTDGLHMVLNQFRAALEKQGIQHIESIQKEFDPNLHEAVGQEGSESAAGTVVKEHTRGYTLHGRLLRPARVSVSSGKVK